VSELDLELELTDHRRSFAWIGQAFLIAAATDPEDRLAAVRELERALATNELKIDRLALDVGILVFVGLMAGKTGTAPRAILESYWTAAPTDQDWRSLLEWHKQPKEGEHGRE
jgi:hypothetical protein